ncbi:ATP-dependent helicase/nuclease subunit A [Parabacteroides sp. PFB2-12]|uniref:UvrD-helicase domain-containing protein n=1 Tax=unclassified Parabacteroides TaxID=2649774 RepID=UPI002472FB25|nr:MULTISPECIES: UvrD-helicase domain-containing protein [unclassified Parabacteroides]MDH6341852.1 ATP-dependent helicase/nuclease subunit A [Parabacteroides sp. PM6-13]MDH6391609.1 ATP-dependent helicase/nuclease subunit A [Parabacteroides sp. PFB2-12]
MLTIYRASAGAGKTHRLTGDYLRLLFLHPGGYRRILAVTFTNKATDEMKTRIIEELHLLASNKKSDHLKDLMEKTLWNETKLREEARRVLVMILHDYSAFQISTIDRFFQQTMRAFTREIGLRGGYGLEMDDQLVLAEAVDNTLADLDKKENKELLKWLLRFAEDKIEESGKWELRKDIMTLSSEVFKESFKQSSDKISQNIADKGALESYQKTLQALIQAKESEAKQLGEKGMEMMREAGLQPSDFKYGKTSGPALFEKLAAGEMKEPGARFLGLPDDVNNWYTKTADPQKGIAIIRLFDAGMNDLVKSVIAFFENLTSYYTAKGIIHHCYTLGILNDISRKIAEYREEKNVMLIADTTELLSKVIDGSEAPFIYEKTGTRIDHYMIDEFQDTSHMQWHNFRPLLHESLAAMHDNLIVGDVKQSIYRFRNSDWKLLDEEVAHDFRPELIREQTLAENWRSCRKVVEFNNSFFVTAPEILQAKYNEALMQSSLNEAEKSLFATKILSAYKENSQEVAPPFKEKEGHVRIEFIEEEENDDEKKGWKEEVMERLPSLLERLQDNGYRLSDIAILTRTNFEGATVADTLLTCQAERAGNGYRYDIISDDALFVGSSPAVRFVIALLGYLAHPEEKTYEQMARFSWYAMKGIDEAIVPFFPEEEKRKLLALIPLSLYEMTEGLCRLYSDHFPDNEQAFLQAFLDLVAEYTRQENADARRFLKWWEESGVRKTIASPDGQDAVRIMTIHKAKGLGMPVVILPFGDWDIDHTKPVILWCKPQQPPFDQLYMVPVRYNDTLAKSHFAVDYFNEKMYAYIDSLNTLYVAMTRAKEEMIVFAPKVKPKKDGSAKKKPTIAALLWAALEPDIEENVYESGTWWKPQRKEKTKEKEEIAIRRLESVSFDDRLHLRLQGKGFFFDNKERKRGVLMHELLSRIRSREDIESSVNSYHLEGLIDREEVTELIDRLNRLLSDERVKSWYTAPTQVLNEVEILFGEGESRRPDRVMLHDGKAIVVDYKFGEVQEKTYQKQVKSYMQLIAEMGYQEVEGYIWYVELGEIEKVVF